MVFMCLPQAPSVDLDALGRQLAESEALLDEHSSMVQVCVWRR